MKSKSLLLIGITLVTATSSYAAEWTLKPIINPNLKYDDNVLMSSEDKDGSFKFSVKPTLEAGYATGNVIIAISAGYSIAHYDTLSRLNESDPFFQISGKKNTERAQWGVTASYSEDAARNIAAEDTGNFSSTSVITSRSISPSYSYSITERDNISLNGSYSEREYSTTEFSDNESKSVSASWQRQFSERLSGNVSATYSLYESGTSVSGTENDTYNLSFGANYLWSERWSFSGQVGARYLDSEQITNGVGISSSSSGTSFNVSASHTSALDSITLSASKALNPSSNGDVNEQESFLVSWSRGLSEKLDLSVTGKYGETTSASETTSSKRENISIRPSLSWKISPKAKISLNYEYSQQKGSPQDKAESNAVYVSLNYDWDGYRVSR